jgi:hypothetical protein
MATMEQRVRITWTECHLGTYARMQLGGAAR